MVDSLNFLMLVCAIVGSMAFGVLSAYWLFKMAFALMRPRPRQAVAAKAVSEVAL